MVRDRKWASRLAAVTSHLAGAPGWYGPQVWIAVASGAAPLPVILREWSLLDVWRHNLHAALGRKMEA